MAQLAFASHVSLNTDELNVLTAVWKDWCDEKDINGNSVEGQAAARSLIDWFQFGITDKRQLRSLLDPL